MTKPKQINLNLEQVQKVDGQSKVMYIRTTKSRSNWMAKHNVSPSKVLNLALDELIKQEK